MLQLTAIGRLTKDPEIKTNQRGTEFVCFDLAVNKGYGDKQTTLFISCCACGTLINPLSKAKKGSLICISGELSTSLYTKKDGSAGEDIKCLVSSFSFINAGKKNDAQQTTQPAQYGQPVQQGQPVQYAQQAQTTQPAQYGQPVQQGQPVQYAQQAQATQPAQQNPYGYTEVAVSNLDDLPF